MTEIEQVSDLYLRLPPQARREAFDFLLFLEQRYDEGGLAGQTADAAAILERVGFIGSLDAESDLSENYKADASLVILAEALSHGRILSTDRRDFHAYRWKQHEPFENLFLD